MEKDYKKEEYTLREVIDITDRYIERSAERLRSRLRGVWSKSSQGASSTSTNYERSKLCE